jgi:single-stranded DNA-binding protein
MSVAVLVTGTLFKEPQERTSQAGRRFVVATIKATTTDNSGSDFWSIMCFSASASEALMRLSLNERLAVQGALKLETYSSKDGETKISRTVFVDHVLAVRQPPKEKKPKKPAAPEGLPLERVNIVPLTTSPDLDDDIPF